MTTAPPPTLPRLPHRAHEAVEDALCAYVQTGRAIAERMAEYLSLSGMDAEADGSGIVAHRGRLSASDPTGKAAARMADDAELAAWRHTNGAIERVADRLSPTDRAVLRLAWFSRDARGQRRRLTYVAAELDLAYPGREAGGLLWRMDAIRWAVASELNLI